MKHDKSLLCFVFKLYTEEIASFPVNYIKVSLGNLWFFRTFFLCFWKLLSQASNCLLVLSVQFKPNNCKHTHSYIILKLLILKASCFLLEEKAYFLNKCDSESYKVWPHCSQWKACPWVSGTQFHPPGCSIPFHAVPVHCGACWKQNVRATNTDWLSLKVPSPPFWS